MASERVSAKQLQPDAEDCDRLLRAALAEPVESEQVAGDGESEKLRGLGSCQTDKAQRGRAMADGTGGSQHSALCLRLMQSFRRVTRGMWRWQDGTAPPSPAPLSPRHVAALEHIRGGPLTVGELAARLGLTLPTVSGVLADLDRAGLIERYPDPTDRRRTIVEIVPAQAALIGEWLDGAAKPLARVLDKLTPGEQEAFLKAMDLLETELRSQDTTS
jgi:DNA-binding MarR family transcriptional regulator